MQVIIERNAGLDIHQETVEGGLPTGVPTRRSGEHESDLIAKCVCDDVPGERGMIDCNRVDRRRANRVAGLG
jgi:hypothetical protein